VNKYRHISIGLRVVFDSVNDCWQSSANCWTCTASMTISKTERSRVRNIYGNAVTPAFPLARLTFMGTPFPCKNIYGNGVPMRSRSTTPLLTPLLRFVLELSYTLFLHCYAAVGKNSTDTSHRVVGLRLQSFFLPKGKPFQVSRELTIFVS